MPINLRGLLLIVFLTIVFSQPFKEDKKSKPNHQPKEPKGPKDKQEAIVLQYKIGPQNNMQKNQKYKTDDQIFSPQPLQPICQCLNQGQCYSVQPYDHTNERSRKTYCKCSRSHIGQKCEQQAEQIVGSKQFFKFININKYKYFYFEPKQQNMFSFTFHLCFDSKIYQNNSILTSQLQSSITFFLKTEDQDGKLQLTEEQNDPTILVLEQNQCKYIIVDYTFFTQTKLKTFQKMILAIKLGKKLNSYQKIESIENYENKDPETPKRSLRGLKYKITTQVNDKNFTQDWKKSHPKTVSEVPRKNYTIGTFRRIYLNFIIKPYEIDETFLTIVFSLITLTAFIVIATMIFLLRTRILGIRIIESFSSNSGLSNDLKHFQFYMPEEFYIKQLQNQMRDHCYQDPDVECSICIGNIQQGQLIRRTPCDHVFHKLCLDSWCAQHLSCPMCRRSLTESKIKQFCNSSMELQSNSDSND